MALSRVFALVGDSNVKRHMNPTNCRDRPLMVAAHVIPCTKMEAFRTSFSGVPPETTVCIVSCVTNFIVDTTGSETISLRVDPLLSEFFSIIKSQCSSNPDRKYLVCPPMYRRSPHWYRDNQSQVLSRFSSAFQDNAAKNLHLMPSFSTPSYESDGVHLSAYSGFEFVVFLFDSAIKLLETASADPDTREGRSNETSRLLGDRVVALEQGLSRINAGMELKTAIDAELHDFRANERLEDSFIVTGLEAIQSGMTGKAWQDRAKSDVLGLIRQLIGRDAEIVVVHNVTSRSPGSEVAYHVQLKNVEDSRMIRSKFGGFFAGGQDRRPAEFRKIGISNCVTKETRVRIAILKLLGQRYKDSNPGAKFQVIGYQPRPLLKLTPPQDSGDRRVKSFNFIEAVQKLPTSFEDSEIMPLIKKFGSKYPGRLKSLFVVLSDDLVPPSRPRSRASKRPSSPSVDGPDGSRPRVGEF